jgi:hypothetical protein
LPTVFHHQHSPKSNKHFVKNKPTNIGRNKEIKKLYIEQRETLYQKNTRTKGNPTSKTLAHKYTKCTSMKI